MTQVKICGTRTLVGAAAAVDAGADYVGFIFAHTRRSVVPESVSDILRQLPRRGTVAAVGVFVNEPAATVRTIAAACGLDAVQLHGDETPAYAAEVARAVPVIKAFRIAGPQDFAGLDAYDVSGYLIDSAIAGHHGGAGVPFDWEQIPAGLTELKRVFLAGGLRVDTVSLAIERVHPAVVDVSSGIETDGRQDADKIAQFIAAVRRMDAKAQSATTCGRP